MADRWYPSPQTCSDRGAVKAKLCLSERNFTCDHCGHTADRDYNAARNRFQGHNYPDPTACWRPAVCYRHREPKPWSKPWNHLRRRTSGNSTARNLVVAPSLSARIRSTALSESLMPATYTFDVFSSLDGFGAAGGNWSGYWGKQGPELLDHRLARYNEEQRMVFGANTYRAFTQLLAASTEDSDVRDPWVTRMRSLQATVVSSTLQDPLDWPDGKVVNGDAVEVVTRLKEESEVPLRSHGSLSMNRALMAAGLVDRVQVTLFPVITGRTGLDPIFRGAADFDLELLEHRTFDGHIQELIYRPSLHG
nr:dihydrofolate reductase family protein [Actinopolyspora mzabensis]